MEKRKTFHGRQVGKKRLLPIVFPLFLFLLIPLNGYGDDTPMPEVVQQNSTRITGVVKDAYGEPVIGANVKVVGTTQGTITDFEGKFSINVSGASAKIKISFIGYKDKEVTAKKGVSLNIVLEEDAQTLGEVQVVAYGVQKKVSITGAISSMKGDDLLKTPAGSLSNVLSGQITGISSVQYSGEPGADAADIYVRGVATWNNAKPLIQVDGVERDFSQIDPNEIESVTVLKDASATAVFGVRGANGVILITTKRANKDKISVEYNGTLTFDTQLAKWDEVQQIYGMGSNGTYSYDAISNTNKSWGPKADGSNMLKYFDGVERPFLIVPDNTSNFFRTGITATNSAIIGVNSGKTGIRFTYTDMRNKDIVPQTHMSRDIFNLRANTSAGKVDLDFSVNYTREDVKNRPALGDSKSNIGKNLMTLATTYDQEWLQTYQTADGEYSNWNGMDPYNVNPYWDIYKNFNKSKKDLFRMNGKAVWNIDPHLKLQATLGAELNWFTFDDYKAPTTPGFEAGRLQNSAFRNRMYNFEVLALYNNHWGDFDFNATLGGNVYKVNNQTTVTTAQDMKIRDVPSLTSFNEISVVPGSYRKQINSVYGAVNVGWKHMLYLDATLRGDQSSTLPTGNNMYMYPSFSGSFVFSELAKLSDLLPYGKVRMSWAQVGSDTDPYQLGLVYTKSKYAYPGYTIGYIDNGTIPNKDLKPTKTNSVEMGLELKFLKNRIGLDFTYYSQISKNQIMGMASSWTTGYNYRLINAGKIENKGIEIALSTRPIQTRDFSWDINLNFSKNSNKVKELDGESDMFELEKASWLDVQVAAKVGENFGSIVGPDFQRNEKGDILIDPQTGLPQYDKSNHVLGNASWDWTGGLLTNFTYKNLSLVAVFDVKVGADLYSMSARAAYESGKSPETLAGRDAWYRSEEERLAAGIAKGADNWKPTGGFVAPGVIDNGDGTYRPNDIYINPEDYWMSVCRNAPSMFIYDNSYVKCRELTLSYNVPKSWLKNVVSGLTVSFVARNPFIVWKNIPNIDPDSNYNNTTGMGLEYGSLPSRRSYGFNVNVKF